MQLAYRYHGRWKTEWPSLSLRLHLLPSSVSITRTLKLFSSSPNLEKWSLSEVEEEESK